MRVLVVLLGCSALLALAGAGVSRATVSQNISAGVNQNRDMNMNFADGTPIGLPNPPGTLIPPGSYTITVTDDSDISDFDLTGPGVTMATGVQDFITVTWNVTFQPCSLYSYANDTVAGSNTWFQTSASATNLAPCTQGTAGGNGNTTPPTTGGATGGKTTTKTTTPAKTTKPANLPFRGSLAAAVGAAGTLSLHDNGKAVASLKPGRYTLTVADKSSKAGFVLQTLKKPATTVSSAPFVGTKKVTVALNVGQWFFYPRAGGKKTYFLVLA